MDAENGGKARVCVCVGAELYSTSWVFVGRIWFKVWERANAIVIIAEYLYRELPVCYTGAGLHAWVCVGRLVGESRKCGRYRCIGYAVRIENV